MPQNRNYLDPEDEYSQSDIEPYSSIANRDPLEDVSALGQISSASDDNLDNEPVSVSPSNPVRDMIAKRMGIEQPPSPDYSNDPLMKQYEGKEKELQDFRQAQRKSDYISNLGQAAAQATQGASTPVQDNSLYSNIQKQNQGLLKGTEDDLGRRQRIVNAIELRKSREGIATDNRLSREAAMNMKSQDAVESRKSREGIATDNRLSREAAMNMRSQDMQARNQDRSDAKLEQQVGKWATSLKDDLDPNKARGGNMASNQKRVDNADRVQALLEQVHNNPDPRQMEELAISTQALLSASGSPAAEQVKALIPHSAIGNANKLKEWILNDPTGTGQQEFVKRMAETVSREKEVATNQVQKAQTQRLSAYGKFKEADPDTYNSILNSYGLGEGKKVSSQDEKASPQLKVISGISYQKVPGGWQEVE